MSYMSYIVQYVLYDVNLFDVKNWIYRCRFLSIGFSPGIRIFLLAGKKDSSSGGLLVYLGQDLLCS